MTLPFASGCYPRESPFWLNRGMKFLMETETLQLEARVVDLVYARGPLPENSYFSRLTLETSVWPK